MFTDEMLRHAAAVSSELFVNAIEATYDPSIIPIPSKKFERKIKKLYHRADHPFFYRTMDRVASVVLAVLLTGSEWLALNVEARAAFFSLLKSRITAFCSRPTPTIATASRSCRARSAAPCC